MNCIWTMFESLPSVNFLENTLLKILIAIIRRFKSLNLCPMVYFTIFLVQLEYALGSMCAGAKGKESTKTRAMQHTLHTLTWGYELYTTLFSFLSTAPIFLDVLVNISVLKPFFFNIPFIHDVICISVIIFFFNRNVFHEIWKNLKNLLIIYPS